MLALSLAGCGGPAPTLAETATVGSYAAELSVCRAPTAPDGGARTVRDYNACACDVDVRYHVHTVGCP